MSRKPRLLLNAEALVDNYQLLSNRSTTETAAVVKAHAYGLGVDWVVPTLREGGCQTFFVAYPEEGVRVRGLAPEATIYVFHGLSPSTLALFHAHRLRPCLNSRESLELAAGQRLAPAVHVDTGMHRLGLSIEEVAETALLACVPSLLMSHLVASDQPESPLNGEQLAQFSDWASSLAEPIPRSLANTGGIFLGPAYHFEVTRPGIGLYGGSPDPSCRVPVRPVASWHAPVLMVQKVRAGETVGYGASWRADRDRTIATCATGYADGLLRSLGNRWCAELAGASCPLVGRVSMDLITVDVTEVIESGYHVGTSDWVELLPRQQTIDDMAAAAGTVAYECLTRLGQRFDREVTSSVAQV
ncbi:MAG: alanine racemase [Gammaproteobacteria bacterium]|nr:alanine racemase [Gammaproteobacteria bacterium]